MFPKNIITYVIICFVAALSPGPGMLALIHHSVNYGFKKSFPLIIGMQAGLLIAAVLAGSGIGIIITSSQQLYFLFKLIGGGYIFYLGLKIIVISFQKIKSKHLSMHHENIKSIFIKGVLLACANPKTVVFFMALLPPFINPKGLIIQQIAILVALLMLSTLIVHCFYGYISEIASLYVNKYIKILNIVTGCFFIILSVFIIH